MQILILKNTQRKMGCNSHLLYPSFLILRFNSGIKQISVPPFLLSEKTKPCNLFLEEGANPHARGDKH